MQCLHTRTVCNTRTFLHAAGIIGNIVAMFILNGSYLHTSFSQLLTSLAFFDLLYLTTMLLESVRYERRQIE